MKPNARIVWKSSPSPSLLKIATRNVQFAKAILRMRCVRTDFSPAPKCAWKRKINACFVLHDAPNQQKKKRNEKIKIQWSIKNINLLIFLGFGVYIHTVWKLLNMSHWNISILAFPTNFCPIETDLSGNTSFRFSKTRPKLTIFEFSNTMAYSYLKK